MHCNGKCHLVKQLQQEDKSSQLPINSAKQKSDVQALSPIINLQFTKLIVTVGTHKPYLEAAYSAPNYTIFHPPTQQKTA